MAYGDKRDYRKIDIAVRIAGVWTYKCSTTWAKDLKEAKEKFCAGSVYASDDVRCHYAPKR